MLYRRVAALAAGVFASMLAPGVAGADDGGYVELLDAGNVPYDTPAGAVLMGRAVCSSLESGGTVEHNEHSLLVGGESVGEADWTKLQAGWLIAAAVKELCPQEQGVLKAYGPPFFVSR
jgi:Protein of unknown function (DUF732)